MNSAAQDQLQRHLWRDEEVLWQGQPLAAGPVAAHAARHGFWEAVGTAIGAAVLGIVVLVKVSAEFSAALLEAGAIVGAVGLVGYVAWMAFGAWQRGRRLAGATVYAVTNRRVMVLYGDDEHWVGAREIAGLRVQGGDIVVQRSLTDAEHRWRASASLEEEVADHVEVARREVVLAAVPDFQRVVALLQTLQRPTAS